MIGNERGIALVITLLIVALLTITVVEFTYSVEIDQRMGRNALNGMQATLLARSGINLGEAFLLHDDDPTVDAYTEDWGNSDALNSQVVVPENMRLRVQIIDENGKFNINMTRPRDLRQWMDWRNSENSNDPNTRPQPLRSWYNAFENLLQGRGIDPQVSSLVFEYWNRLFEAAFPSQAGLPVGTPGALPTQPAATGGVNASINAQLLTFDFPSLDDAGVIPGLTPSAIRRLRPVLTALPAGQTRVNVNTAPPDVLRAIVGDDGVVDNIVAQREGAPLRQQDLGALLVGLNQPGSTTPNLAANMLGTISSYFLIRASAIINPNPITGRGGIRRSASMLVRRDRRTAAANAPTTSPRWTLTQLDWQKEGGAALFAEKDDQEAGVEEFPPSGLADRAGR